MGLKKKKVTQAMIERYEILRRLYISDKTVDDLASEMPHVPRQKIVNGLGKLLTNAAIKKIHFTEERIEITEIQIAKDLAGVKDKQFTKYHLTDHGRKKLGYYEWKYKMHEKVNFEWADSFNQKYYDEMTRLITNVMHLPT